MEFKRKLIFILAISLFTINWYVPMLYSAEEYYTVKATTLSYSQVAKHLGQTAKVDPKKIYYYERQLLIRKTRTIIPFIAHKKILEVVKEGYYSKPRLKCGVC